MGSLTVGLILFGHQWQLLSSPAWAAVGVVFSMVLYFAKTYTAFFGGQILAIYTMSLWPMLSKRFISHNPGKAIPLAMTVCFIFVLLSVWVVAYNFVPGGIITRERSDAMLILTTLVIGFASRNVRQKDSKAIQSKKRRAESLKRAAMKEGRKDQGDKKQVTFFGRVFRRLSTITEEGDEDWTETEKGSKTHQARAREVNVAEEIEGQKFHNRVIKGISLSYLEENSTFEVRDGIVPFFSLHFGLYNIAGILIFLIALLGFAWRYQSPPSMPVKVCTCTHVCTHTVISTTEFSDDNFLCRSIQRCSVEVSGHFTLAMTTRPTPAWRELPSSYRTQVSIRPANFTTFDTVVWMFIVVYIQCSIYQMLATMQLYCGSLCDWERVALLCLFTTDFS